MKDNETISEIRRIRREIAEQFDFDPKRLVEVYKERQKAGTASSATGPEDHSSRAISE
jgi:hypothetical protein